MKIEELAELKGNKTRFKKHYSRVWNTGVYAGSYESDLGDMHAFCWRTREGIAVDSVPEMDSKFEVKRKKGILEVQYGSCMSRTYTEDKPEIENIPLNYQTLDTMLEVAEQL